jgi:hypothetical protein
LRRRWRQDRARLDACRVCWLRHRGRGRCRLGGGWYRWSWFRTINNLHRIHVVDGSRAEPQCGH